MPSRHAFHAAERGGSTAWLPSRRQDLWSAVGDAAGELRRDALFDIGPESFDPPPKVDSSVVRLQPLVEPMVGSQHMTDLCGVGQQRLCTTTQDPAQQPPRASSTSTVSRPWGSIRAAGQRRCRRGSDPSARRDARGRLTRPAAKRMAFAQLLGPPVSMVYKTTRGFAKPRKPADFKYKTDNDTCFALCARAPTGSLTIKPTPVPNGEQKKWRETRRRAHLHAPSTPTCIAHPSNTADLPHASQRQFAMAGHDAVTRPQ